ncbi:MAG TPA: polyprenyl synthetase family protein, partial [Caulobacteraceae bacterium]|nr:polyprenyl synthetase family protein [Caulobacteraceae bacterium]
LEIIGAKTAELFAAAAEAGAVSAGADERRAAALRSYGNSLGLAFQLADDALDYAGSAETLGKNAGDDFREGKATLPLILAIARTGAREAEFWERAIGRKEQTDADFRRARELVVGAGGLDATLSLAADYAEDAKRALVVFPAGEWREALEALADFAVSRRA